ncbi:MAG: MerR family DNA-binding protein [Polyangiales bacterium]
MTTKALRFYEVERLVPRARRRSNGYRDYDDALVARVRFIRRAQAIGFSLREIRGFLAASDARDPTDARLRAVARAKVEEIQARIADLDRVRAAIELVLRRKKAHDGPCPILASLGGDDRALG